MAFLPAIADEALGEGASRGIELGGRAILLCRFEGTVYALENRCSHAYSPLDGGRVRAGCIQCPLHGARFALATGQPVGAGTNGPIATYRVAIVDQVIHVDPDQPARA